MNTCDRHIGRQLLEGTLSSEQESAVMQHLGSCPRCQEWLERDAGDADQWSAARQLLACSSERASWSPIEMHDESQLTQQLRPGQALVDGERALPIDLSFLAPADDPAYLGRIGSHEIAGVIGFGGMGVVLKAVDRSLSRYVAIKVLSPVLANVGAARQRFAREARAMAALSHEHVVPIYAVDEHRGLPYFAMEYVPGGTLQARLSHEGPLEVVAAVRIAMQTALGLSAAHDSGLVHRDIKPANILLDRGVERVRVADFGLARAAAEASYTASGVLAGTPQFMSPEQVRGEPCDGRSDLFSLGSVLYTMCTGHEPFRAESVYGVLQRIVNDEPRSIRQQNANVPAWLEDFVATLMAKDPAERFASASQVAELLERELAYLQNPGVGPAPARPWLRRSTLSQARRRRAAWAASAVGVAVAIGVAAYAWWPTSQLGPGGGWDGARPQAASGAGVAASAGPARPTVPLWDADGLAEVQQLADLLEAGGAGPAPSPALDPWVHELESVRAGVEVLSLEPTFPDSLTSPPTTE